MDSNRHPLGLLIASGLTLVVAIGAILFATFLFAIAAGVVPILDSPRAALVAVLAVMSLGYGVAAFVAAAALWKRRSWAWPLAAAVHLIALSGVLIAAATGGTGAHTAAGVTLSAVGLAALVPEETRRALSA
jgi:hypothetical protein